MKIHTFIKDSKRMAQNEQEAIKKRERRVKQREQTENVLQPSVTEDSEQTEKTQKKTRKKKDQEVV
jgi:hypothetical protein